AEDGIRSRNVTGVQTCALPICALHEVIKELYLPLTRLWAENGLYWQRVYPILFLSGPGCSTNCHWDPSAVLIVQLSGRKRYYAQIGRASCRERGDCGVVRGIGE